uniref:Uncharacterized protein n=1 Tax=viral metagenome TaxID=1070528 RepID=A0A6C0J6Y2_9ZZZZ
MNEILYKKKYYIFKNKYLELKNQYGGLYNNKCHQCKYTKYPHIEATKVMNDLGFNLVVQQGVRYESIYILVKDHILQPTHLAYITLGALKFNKYISKFGIKCKQTVALDIDNKTGKYEHFHSWIYMTYIPDELLDSCSKCPKGVKCTLNKKIFGVPFKLSRKTDMGECRLYDKKNIKYKLTPFLKPSKKDKTIFAYFNGTTVYDMLKFQQIYFNKVFKLIKNKFKWGRNVGIVMFITHDNKFIFASLPFDPKLHLLRKNH